MIDMWEEILKGAVVGRWLGKVGTVLNPTASIFSSKNKVGGGGISANYEWMVWDAGSSSLVLRMTNQEGS